MAGIRKANPNPGAPLISALNGIPKTPPTRPPGKKIPTPTGQTKTPPVPRVPGQKIPTPTGQRKTPPIVPGTRNRKASVYTSWR